MGYSLLGALVCTGLAMQREVIPSPQTSVPVTLHTVTSKHGILIFSASKNLM